MSAGTHFAYAKKGQKRAKNGHFRPKNASIDLKVVHILYLGGFYDLSNFQRNRKKIGAKLEQNRSKFGAKNTKNFGGNRISSFNFHQNGPIYFICDLWDTYHRSEWVFWLICFFSHFMAS